MTRYLILALSLLACAPAHAAVVTTWSGAGPNACDGRCDLEWFQTTLTDQERSDLQAAMEARPGPQRIVIEDGDVFSVMSYFKDGAPVAYRTTTVAALHYPTYGEGWRMDGYTVVKLDDCQNWSIIRHGQRVPVYSAVPFYSPPIYTPVIFTTTPGDPWLPPGTPLTPWTDPLDPYDPWTPTGTPTPPPAHIPPVPVPAPFLLLLGGLGTLLWAERGLTFWRT